MDYLYCPFLQMNGATYQGKISQSFGGVGRNLADCLSRLDLNPVFVSAVGRDTDLNACSHMVCCCSIFCFVLFFLVED